MSEPCPGKPSPVRPAVLLPMCRECPLRQEGAKRRPPATHDGRQWRCGDLLSVITQQPNGQSSPSAGEA